MIIMKQRNALLGAMLLISLSGSAVYAERPEIGGSSSEVTQSSMFDVKSGTAIKTVPQVEGLNLSNEVAVEETVETVAMGDASLYLSETDNVAIEAQANKKIASIDFKGVPEEVKVRLAPLLTTKAGAEISVATIRNDVAALGSTGVFAQISPEFTDSPEGVRLVYRMVSNPIVKGVTFSGNTIFTDEYLQSVMQVPKDSTLNFVLVNQKVKEIEKKYLEQGYLLVSVPNVQVSSDGMLQVTISEGVIEDFVLVGNEKTRNHVILREMRMKKGTPFNKFLASRSMERLYNLGYFEDVNMKLLPGTQSEHNVIIEIDVIEQKTGIITVGAGYSESDGLVGLLELGDTNFRGMGDKVNFHWEFGGSGNGKNYEVSYTRPWINSNGDSLGASVFNRIYQYNDYNADGNTVAEYDKRRKGWNLTWGHVSNEYRTNYVNFESSKESYQDGNGFHPGPVMEALPQSEQEKWKKAIMDNMGRTNSMTFTHVFDNRDNYFNASKGRRISFSAQWGGHGLGGDFDFYKFTTEGRFYHALKNRHVLALRLMAGYISGDVSYGSLFDLGGANTLRGYEDDQFKGKNMYAATLEYRFPIAKKVQGVVFTDLGSAWNLDNTRIPWYSDDKSLHFSAGVGLRLQTPIGPIRLDYGHGDQNKFHFSFGTQF